MRGLGIKIVIITLLMFCFMRCEVKVTPIINLVCDEIDNFFS